MTSRKEVLLRAVYGILKEQSNTSEVLHSLSQTVHYDDADCDGYCLMADIAAELGIDD